MPDSKPISRRAIGYIKSFGILYAIVLAIFVFGESYMIYPGLLRTQVSVDDSDPKLNFVDIETADNETIRGLVYKPENPRGVVILCHGNGDLVCFMPNEIKAMAQRFNVEVVTFDYRGYGNSEGFPTAGRLYRDGQAVYDYVTQSGYAPSEIFVYGRSLGGAVGVHIAEENEIAGLIIRSSFSSMADLAQSKFFFLPVKFFIRNRFPSAKKIANYKGPLLQRHGDRDLAIPIRFGKELHEAATGALEKEFFIDQGAGHNGPNSELFWRKFGEFIDRNLQ